MTKNNFSIALIALIFGVSVATQNANADDMMGSMPPAAPDSPAMTDPDDHDHEQMVKDHKKMMDAAAMKGSKSPMKKKPMPMKDKGAMPPMEPGDM